MLDIAGELAKRRIAGDKRPAHQIVDEITQNFTLTHQGEWVNHNQPDHEIHITNSVSFIMPEKEFDKYGNLNGR